MNMEGEMCELRESGRDRLNLLLRNLGPEVRSAWALKGIWEPEQQLGTQPAPLGMRETRGTSGNLRKEVWMGLVVRDLLAWWKGAVDVY